MREMKDAPFLREAVRTCEAMYAHGWDERSSGNLSLLLGAEEIAPYADAQRPLRTLETGFCAPALAGRYFLVTATGSYFKNVPRRPERELGLIRIAADGAHAELLWGYEGGGRFTSELPAHLMGHAARLAVDPDHRVILHCHPDNVIAMTHVHPLDARAFTRTLWSMCTEAVLVYPDGVGVLPWMVCGTNELGAATAEELRHARIVVWAQHGIYACGSSPDDAFGRIESVDKAAGIYLRVARFPERQDITGAQLRALTERFGVTVREGWLDED